MLLASFKSVSLISREWTVSSKETRHAPVLGVTLRIAKPLKRVGALYHKPVNGQSRVLSARGVNRAGNPHMSPWNRLQSCLPSGSVLVAKNLHVTVFVSIVRRNSSGYPKWM